MPITGRGGRRNYKLRRRKPTSSSNPFTGITLPANLIIQILCHTPVKSLVRFKCVSKSWYSLINHPNFIKKHLHFNTFSHNTHVICNAYNVASRNCSKLVLLLSVDNVPVTLLDIDASSKKNRDYPRKINFVDFSKKMLLAGSINGVVLVIYIDELNGRFVGLWNPGIRQWKVIKVGSCGEDVTRSAFGLGCDKASDDIKIIRVISMSFCRSEFFASSKRARVEIYSVNRGCWEDVDHGGELSFWPGRCNCKIIVKGVPYFVGDDVMPDNPVSHQHQILGGFDPCTGLFKKVHYPEHFREESTWVEPFEYQDSLAVMVQFTPGKDNEQMIDMYLLDDDTTSWIKMYTIGPYPYLEYHAPHQSFRTGEIVLEEQLQNIRGLYLYNPKTELVSFLIGIDSLKPLWLESYSHTESLVSIEGMELIGNNVKNKKTKPKKMDRTELLTKDFEMALHL